MAQRRIPVAARIHPTAAITGADETLGSHPGNSAADRPKPARRDRHGAPRGAHLADRLRRDPSGRRHPDGLDHRGLARPGPSLPIPGGPGSAGAIAPDRSGGGCIRWLG